MDVIEPQRGGLCLTQGLSEYIAQYSGHTRLRRLLTIAQKCPQYEADAMRMLISILKQGINTSFYLHIYEEGVASAARAIEPFDSNWSSATERAAAIRLETLEKDLNTAKSMISKEGIRKAHSNIADFHYERGNLDEALKSYCVCRDYCTQPWHLDEIYENAFSASADLGDFNMMGFPTFSKTSSGGPLDRPLSEERRQIAAALVALRQKDYASAGSHFINLKRFSEYLFPTLLSNADIAVYGTMLAVATMSREELRSCVTASSAFKQFLECVPSMEGFLNDFLECRYQNVMDMCCVLEDQYQHDIILQKHLGNILSLIVDKLFLQYIEPYESIDLSKMALNLNKPMEVMIIRLISLIGCGKIQARLDTVSNTLRRAKRNSQENTVKSIVKLTDEIFTNSQRALFRMSLLQHGIFDDEQAESDIFK